ncbi:MAG TPA: ABC transporter substrate-binding protein [Chloroflexota bacterium]|nr:ABC transporter substrate-binding protein [Chloroflexota bacterium]
MAPNAKLIVSVNSNPPTNWPLYVADSAGLFGQKGLDVNLQVTGGGPAQLAALLSGQVQVAQAAGFEAVNAAANGADLVVVSVLEPVLAYAFVVPASVKTPADLKGQKIGVAALGGTGDSAARMSLAKLGLDPAKDVTIVAIGGVPNTRAALASGSIAGAAVPPIDMIALQAQGFYPLVDLSALAIPAAGGATVTTRAFASSQRSVLQRYVDAQVQGTQITKQNRQLAIDVLKKQLKSDDDQTLSKLYDYYSREVLPSQPYPKPEQFGDALAQLAKANNQFRDYDVGNILDLSFVQRAADRGR